MKYKICINAGHAPNGNPDPGAQYYNLRESDIACSVSKSIVEELVNRGYDVLFVQDDSLKKICYEANKFQANLFVSIHCNAHENPSANGTEVFVYKKSSNAYKCAKSICDNICKAIGTYNRGVKTANYQVLRDTAMPACLVEMFFLSNTEDVRKMQEKTSAMVSAICDGIEIHFKEETNGTV